MRFLLFVVSIAIHHIMLADAHALTLGDFKNTYNTPGYINFDHNSDVYNGPLELKDRNDNVSRQTPSQLLELFFDQNRISIKKLDEFKNQVIYLRTQAKIVYCQDKLSKTIENNLDCKKSSVLNNLENSFGDESSARAIDFVLTKIEEAKSYSDTITKNNINKKSSLHFLSSLFDALEVYDAVKGEDEVLGRFTGMPAMILKGAKLLKSPNTIKKNRAHAANLLRLPNIGKNSDDLFYSENELNELQDQGYDLSLLDPIDSGYWRKPKSAISKYNTFNYNSQDSEPFKRILNNSHDLKMLTDPNEVIDVTYTGSLPKNGTTAKIDVFYKNTKFKMKFVTDKFGGVRTIDPFIEASRIIQGSEVNIESAVNNLAAALGFTVDPTYYKKKVHLYLPDEAYKNNNFNVYVKDFFNTMSSRFSLEMNATSAFRILKTDISGKKYFEIKGVAFEQKSNKKTDINVGSFIRHGLGKSLKREHRGFALFLAWVMDIDTKDDNDKVKLVPYETEDGKLSYHVAFSSSDMGGSFAGSNPNFFNFNLIKSFKEKDGEVSELELNYRRLYSLRVLQTVNIDDAKWMARMMAQLSYRQIKSAFLSGGYPDIIAEYFTQVMISKRNQLISTLGLMNSSTLDSENKNFIIRPGGEFRGTIKGYENYFVDGKLFDPHFTIRDPEVDIGKRPWGNDYSSFGGENSIFKVLSAGLMHSALNLTQNTLLANLSITNNGLTPFPLGLNRGNLFSNNCGGSCFLHGMLLGANLFIPFRYVIPNPNKNQTFKYWLVDIYRVGAFLGNNGSNLLGDLGIDAIPLMNPSFSASAYKITEYIKIKPVKNVGFLFKEIERWATMPGMPIKSARAAYIENMEQDDILIHSSYYGMQGSLVFRPQLAMPISIGPSIRVTGNILTANRVTLLKEKNNTIMAVWGRLKEATKIARLNLIDFFIQIPILEAQLKKLHAVETTYKFSLDVKFQKELLMKNLSSTTPESIPVAFKLDNRTTDLERRRFTLNLLGLYVKKHYTSKVEVDYNNFQDKISASDFALEKKYQTKKLHRGDFSVRERKIKASINSIDDLYVKINFLHKIPGAKKKDFINLYHFYSPILPDNFIVFDLNSVKNYFGDLQMDSTAIIGKNGLRQIFNPQYSEHFLCLRYATIRRVSDIYKACEDTSYKISNKESNEKLNDDGVDNDSLESKFHSIWKKYQKARSAYWKVQFTKYPRSSKSKKETYKNLEKIIDLFADNKKFQYRSLKFLVFLAGKQNLFRKSSISSSLDAFPGGVDEIDENAHARGELEPTGRMLSDAPELAFELFSDRIHQAVGPIFLNYAAEL